MKKLLSFFTFALLFCSMSSAQDIITKKTGEGIAAVVTEVNPDNIKYKLFSNQNGPVYTIYKSEVSSITYQNGNKDIFSNSKMTEQEVAVNNLPRDLKFKDLKGMYNPKSYHRDIDDRYSPAWCAIGSSIIPGLGQMCCREWGRGLAFLGANVGCYALFQSTQEPVFYVAQIAVDIWAICDAVKVAKVLNMYSQDIRELSSVDVNIVPNISYIPTANGLQPNAGLKLAISF